MNGWLAGSWVLVTMIFIVATLAASVAAARSWPRTAVLIAVTLTTLIALAGGRRMRVRA